MIARRAVMRYHCGARISAAHGSFRLPVGADDSSKTTLLDLRYFVGDLPCAKKVIEICSSPMGRNHRMFRDTQDQLHACFSKREQA
jgi:hypothetical protein